MEKLIFVRKITGDLFSITTVNISSIKKKQIRITFKNEVINEIHKELVIKHYYIFKELINIYYEINFKPVDVYMNP